MNDDSSRPPADPADLRRAFGRFGTGVTIVTTLAEDGSWVGLTANSFNTVSLDPPIVVWSLSTRSPSLPAFEASGRFVVNVLSQEQLHLSQRFSRPQPDKFAGVDIRRGLSDLPTLQGSAAIFECRTVTAEKMGDHILFLGEVERYAYHDATPLLYLNGRYAQAVCLDPV